MASGTRAPSTIVTINLTGQTDFNIPFEYLARKFVVVTLLGTDRKVLTLNTDYRFVSNTVISLANPSPAGYTQLELRRETSATERLVDFHDGSILRAYDLNLSQIQTLHVAEEARDLTADTIGVNDAGHLDARNRRIVNLADAVNGRDAITLGQVLQWNESAYNSMIAAQNAAVTAQSANREAQEAKDVSVTYAGESRRWADASQSHATFSENKATVSQQAAQLSQEAATRSEQAKDSIRGAEVFCTQEANRAHNEAERAKVEANKLGNMNEFAASLQEVTPSHVLFNRTIDAFGHMYSRANAGDRPVLGLWRAGIQEAGMSIDGNGLVIIGGGNQSAPEAWTYWNPQNNWMVNSMSAEFDKAVTVNGVFTARGRLYANENLDIGGTLTTGAGRNSSIDESSWGDSSAGNWVNKKLWKWYAGGLEVGVVRGAGVDGNALIRHIDGASGIYADLTISPQANKWEFSHSGSPSFTLYGDGNFWMRWAGDTIHNVLAGKMPTRRTSHTHLGQIQVSDNYSIALPTDVRGLNGFWMRDGVRCQIMFPSTDCVFQLNAGGDFQIFELSSNGQVLTRRYGYGEGHAPYDFYLDR